MTVWQQIGIGLVIAAFVGAKLFLLFSGKTGIWIAVLGAVIMVVSEPATAA